MCNWRGRGIKTCSLHHSRSWNSLFLGCLRPPQTCTGTARCVTPEPRQQLLRQPASLLWPWKLSMCLRAAVTSLIIYISVNTIVWEYENASAVLLPLNNGCIQLFCILSCSFRHLQLINVTDFPCQCAFSFHLLYSLTLCWKVEYLTTLFLELLIYYNHKRNKKWTSWRTSSLESISVLLRVTTSWVRLSEANDG